MVNRTDRGSILFKAPDIDGKRVRAVIGAGLALVVLSCAGPYYERAAIAEGYSGGAGIGITAGERLAQVYGDMDEWPTVVRNVSGLATGYVRYGWSSSACFFMQATGGYGAWNHEATYYSTNGDLAPSLLDIQLGVKFRAGRNGAVKAGIGLPGLLDIAYLHDFGRPWTVGVGVGLRGLSLGLTNHLNISPMIVQHTSLTIAAFPFPNAETKRPWVAGAFLGLGWDFLRPADEDE
jgi:hypothetical protein